MTTKALVTVRVGFTRAVRISYSVKERPQGCDYCGGSGHRTYFAYGRLLHVYCNRDCMVTHQLETLMQPADEPK